jgi:hypothetical protein
LGMIVDLLTTLGKLLSPQGYASTVVRQSTLRYTVPAHIWVGSFSTPTWILWTFGWATTVWVRSNLIASLCCINCSQT